MSEDTKPTNSEATDSQLSDSQLSEKEQKHVARQKKLKAAVDERIAAAQTEQGVFQVITGNGKGKSTSGFGTVARCVGHGKKAAVVQFIKGGWECGERNLLEKVGVPFTHMETGFTWETQNRESDTQAAQATWQLGKKYLEDESIDLVLLDELTYMVKYGYIEVEDILTAIKNRPPMQSVIITGRAAHRELTELADTVSEVRNVKHAFEAGVKAQKGFDY
ncbi:cob(I)alamin adenolsyltransferase/cobinamide ATP-dependent adenolsyltransferase [Psychrosphaera saromensis]|uniref:Corrinoid adenosyltransferase n=1 Tax=Psychrosphaera saromensis TaxID=716813 RepID=A0A2S7UT46_9GAMM|nr:cob(I)yrinic acid a,c-diamide adenosyltransferase [Psychrosphaera saromensis]PQJ52451.1 cob(I)yrinic acid a,c-diamide adenosyltransferase [Psychrosphaera saromensis]GHB73840.1 cob(I)alamin adenolsyltransferase/cobinamide ATP-dependent adenolsyltransferase [Psychrosphaera saromensis]GLQ13377.1 cob(I)alamin adenosyltransferase/cobinamide ATP-dependent adenosyltransferase [Psychrosphaera saromensis]